MGETLMAAVRAWTPEQQRQRMAKVRQSLQGEGSISDVSPCYPLACTQDHLEPLLRRVAQARGVDVRFETELVDLQQDGSGVTASILERPTGAVRTVRASYLIAASGAKGQIREGLGIPATSSGPYGHFLSILFQADLSEIVRGHDFSACVLDHPQRYGLLGPLDTGQRWIYFLFYQPERGETPEDFSPQRCVDILRTVLGLPELDIELKGVLPWSAMVRVADSFHDGRVFLAGDAAHQMPPWRGQGATSAVQDTHNLAWKLAAVLRSSADPSLLATYDAERRPVALTTANESILDDRDLDLTGISLIEASTARMLGCSYRYVSTAVVPDNAGSLAPISIDDVVLDGQPGTRCPHVWIEHDGRRISTLDLFGTDFVLLTGPDGAAWCVGVLGRSVSSLEAVS